MTHLRVEPLQREILAGVSIGQEDGERRRVDLAVVPVCEDERPLQGLAGFIDWRCGGRLTRMLRSGFCSGRRGESVLLPGGRGLPMERLVLVGFGRCDGLSPGDAAAEAGRAVGIATGLGPLDVMFAMPGAMRERELVEAVFSGLADALPRLGPATSVAQWWVIADGSHAGRLRRLLGGPPRAADA